MPAPIAHNGYRSWNAWNVSLWINNDESLYRMAYEIASKQGVTRAVNALSRILSGTRTPDGAVYNHKSIRSALEGIV